MNKTYNVSFIGSGHMSREHAKAFSDHPNLKLIGVYSRNIDNASYFADEFSLPVVAGSIDELYQRTSSDIVVVAVAELALPEILAHSFKYPWVHLLEKPVGINVQIAEEILLLQSKLNAKAFVGLNRRFYGGMLALKRRLDSKGQNRVLVVHDQEDQVSALKAGQPNEVVKNWAFANSIHLIDLFLYFCRGEIENVMTYQNRLSNEVVFTHSKVDFSSGDTGIYNCIWNNSGPWSLSCYFPEEYWEMKPLEETSRRILNNKTVNLPHSDWDINFKPGLRMQVMEIYNFMLTKSCNLPSIYEATSSMKLVERIYDGF